LVVWVVLAACSSEAATPPPPVAPEAEADEPAPLRDHDLQWTQIVESNPGCFYFSGPTGRDNRLAGRATLERSATGVRLEVGGAQFDGTLANGEVRLRRESRHEFDGPWQAEETIVGRYTDGVLIAHYVYDECQLGRRCRHDCILTGTLRVSR
jgi:hypothetical protein